MRYGKGTGVSYDESLKQALVEVVQDTNQLSMEIADSLRNHVRDCMRQIEVTAGLLVDALIVINPDGLINSFNPAAEKIFGWKADEVIGQSVTILFHHTSGIPVTVGSLMEVFMAEDCFTYPIEDTPVNGVMGYRKDLTAFFIDVTVSSFHRVSGDVDHILVVRDVTKFVDAQRTLLAGEIHYRTIFDHSPDGIAIIQNHNVVEMNSTLMALAAGRDIMSLFNEGDRDKINMAIEDHLRGVGKIYDFRVYIDDVKMIVSMVPVETQLKRPATIMTVRDLSCTR